MSRFARIRSLSANALLALVTSALFLGALELLSRAFERTSPDETAERLALWEKAWQSDFYLLTSHSPGWPPNASVNRDGLPDRLHPVDRYEGSYRIAILGDSVTAGTPFEPALSWPSMMRALAEERGPFVEVMNVALWGWSTRQQRTAYETIVRRYRPDRVVVAICLNDVEELQNNLSRPTAFFGWLHRRSALVRRLVDAEGRSIRMVEELLSDSPNVSAGFERLFSELVALNHEVRDDGSALTVVVLPMQSQVSGKATSRLPQERIGGLCRREGIDLVDPLHALAGHESLFEDVVHLTVEGRQRLAHILFESLVPSDRLSRLPPAASPGLDAALRSSDARDRAEAAWVLGRLSPPAPETPSILASLLEDPAPMVRTAAAAALARLGTEAQNAVRPILDAMSDPVRSVRWHATEAVVALEAEPGSASGIARHLTHSDFYVRAGAAFALQQMGPGASAALPELRLVLADEDEGVRAMAVQAVASVGRGDTASVQAFLTVLNGPPADGSARWKAARAIGRLGPAASEALPSLVSALDDSNGHVRREAASAIGRIGAPDEATVAALLRAAQDAWPPVRRAAATALGRIACDHSTARETLGVLATDATPEVSEAARLALRTCNTR